MCYYYQAEVRHREDFPRLWGTAPAEDEAPPPRRTFSAGGAEAGVRALSARLAPAGMRGQAVRLGALRLLLFKLLLLDVLLTCGRLRAPPSARGDPRLRTRPHGPAGAPPSPAASARRLDWAQCRGDRGPGAQRVRPAGAAAPLSGPGAPGPSPGGGDAFNPPSLGLVLMSPPVFHL